MTVSQIFSIFFFRSDSGFDSDLDSLLNGNGISSAVDVYQKLKVKFVDLYIVGLSYQLEYFYLETKKDG